MTPSRYLLPIAVCLLVHTSSTQAGSLTCMTIPKLMSAYVENHVKHRTLDKELMERSIVQFMKAIDPSRTLFTTTETNELNTRLLKLFNEMSQGNCNAFAEVRDKLVSRTQENESLVRKFLGDKNYKFDPTIELITDADKRGTPSTLGEREELLKKLIQFQMAIYLSTGETEKEAKRLLIHRYELATKHTQKKTVSDLYDSFLASFSSGLDPHSLYLSAENWEDFKIDMRLSLEGIGALLSTQDGYTVVEEIIPGGAADRSGLLRTKDKIIAVAQGKVKPVNVIDMPLPEVVRLIRGKKGTTVKLSILRQEESIRQLEVAIVRDKIKLEDQAAQLRYEIRKLGEREIKLGILDLPSFYGGDRPEERSAYRDMVKLLAEAKQNKIDGLVLDLSRNGGGLLKDAVWIAGLFIKTGPVVATKDFRDTVEIQEDLSPIVEYDGPLVILTSRLTASASEIVAGALKNYRRALLVGDEHTFGKGTVQTLSPLPSALGALKITTSMFFLPSGVSNQQMGVPNDIVFPSPFNSDDIGEKSLDNSLPNTQIPAFAGDAANSSVPGETWKPVTLDVIRKLADASAKRVAVNAEFKEIVEKMEKTKANQGMIRLSEVMKEQKEAKTKEKENEKKSMKERRREANKVQIDESINILADLINEMG